MNLCIENLKVKYNNVSALRGISFNVEKGEFITLIGSNGAGKSTTLRTISGLVRPTDGTVSVDGTQIDRLGPDKIMRLGIAHVPEGRRVFKDLTVKENLYLGAYIHNDNTRIEEDLNKIFVRFPRLQERQHQLSRSLSGGEQQMLAIGRALMSRPKILLLDEPSLGLAPMIVEEIGKILLEINSRGVTVILVEQNADLALQLADHSYVLETGKITMQGEASQLADDDHVKKAYLGI